MWPQLAMKADSWSNVCSLRWNVNGERRRSVNAGLFTLESVEHGASHMACHVAGGQDERRTDVLSKAPDKLRDLSTEDMPPGLPVATRTLTNNPGQND